MNEAPPPDKKNVRHDRFCGGQEESEAILRQFERLDQEATPATAEQAEKEKQPKPKE